MRLELMFGLILRTIVISLTPILLYFAEETENTVNGPPNSQK